MGLGEIKNIVKEMNITEDEEDLCFKAAVILLSGLSMGTCSCSKLKRFTNYWWKEVLFIMHNYWANGIIYEYHWNLQETESPNDTFEIILCSMAASGEIVRISEGIKPHEKPLQWEEFLERVELCNGFATARSMLTINIDLARDKISAIKENRNRILKRREDVVQDSVEYEETPQWLLDKQKKIKEIAKQFES